jgi:hypothetical protein
VANLILWNTLNHNVFLVRPVGAHQIAQWLIKHGYTVKVIDFCSSISTDDLVEITRKFIDNSTIAVGVSSTFWNLFDPITITSSSRYPQGNKFTAIDPDWVNSGRRKIESLYPELKWLLGGASSQAISMHDWIKFHGHAEDSILKFLDEKSGKNIARTPFTIQSMEWSYGEGLGILPHEVLGIELGRGCQFKCGFCRYPLLGKKKNSYLRNFNLVKHELIQNYEKFGVTRYSYLDDTVNESSEKIEIMADIAQSLPFKLEWVGYGRLDLIGSNRPSIQTLKDSGLRSMFFGIETFHPTASKAIGKAWNGKHGKEFLLELKEIWGKEINFHTNFIVGLPGESEIDIDNTIQWCIDNDIPSWKFGALNISIRQDLLFKSVFDENYAEYGYKFTNPLDDSYWENEYWNAQTAVDKQLSVSRQNKNSRPSDFALASLAGLGYSIDELINTPQHSLPYGDMFNKRQSHIDQYVHYQKNIANAY